MEYWDKNELRRLASGKLIEEVFDNLKSSAQHLGFKHSSILVFPTGAPTSVPLFSKNNLPVNWTEHFQRRYGYRDNPIIAHCQHSLTPLFWRKSLFDPVPGLWDDLCLFGLSCGTSQSVHDNRGLTSIFCFVQDDPYINPEELHAQMGLLWLINKTHVSLLDQFFTAIRPTRISPKELDILKWTAEGKTASEVAGILSISERTVSFHLQNVFQKLQAKNKIAAVITATRRGLI